MITGHVQGCEALAESLERSGRLDLASLCDRAAFWLDGSLDRVAVGAVVRSCHETLAAANPEALADQIVDAVKAIEQAIRGAEDTAKLQAVALIVDELFGGTRWTSC